MPLSNILLEEGLNTESRVNDWYHESATKLEQDYNQKSLREEQFRRKRALLRVEYWALMDKVRNNAAPTMINF